MPSEVSRRQNSSCDSCRRLKRRCILPDDASSKSPKSCRYCTHLGRTCTFDFVAARATKRRRGLTNISSSDAISDDIQAFPMEENFLDSDLWPATPSFIKPFENLPILNSASMAAAGSTMECDNFCDLLPPEFADLTDIFPAWSQDSGPPFPAYNCLTLSKIGSETHSQLPIPSLSPDNFMTTRASPSRPIDLLNSVFGADELDSELVKVYDTVFGHCASRFLSHRSNIFSGSYRYCFEHEIRQRPGNSTKWTISNERMLSDSMAEYPTNPEVKATRITLVGIARFLDIFGGFFGNPLTKSEQRIQERTLSAVCKAFSLQWLPLPSEGSENSSLKRFKDAWREAHGRLTTARYKMSFRRIFAILLFRMTNHPQEARFDAHDRTSPQVLLDWALQDLQHLVGRVRKYCEELLPTSRYRTLLEMSLSAFQWFAYLRDTSTSLSTGRPCILPYPPCCEGEIFEHTDFNDEIPSQVGLCEEETGKLFIFCRHVIGFRSILEQYSLTTLESKPGLIPSITKCIGAIENMSVNFTRWLKTLESGYPKLSREAQASSSLLLIFWSLGILCFVEQLDSAQESWSASNAEFTTKRDIYLSSAVDCMIRTAQVVEENGLFKTFDENLELRADDPTRCHIHVSSEFMVAALVKGIHHALAINAAHQSVLELSSLCSDERAFASHPLLVAPLVALLSGMTETVSGSLSAAVALQELVQKNGDALMDCCI